MLTGGRIIEASADISSLGALAQKLFILFLLCAAMAIAVKHENKQYFTLTMGVNFLKFNKPIYLDVYSLSSRQQVLFLIFLDARASRLHLQRGGGGLLRGWLDKMSKQLCLLQQVLKSVGPVCLLYTHRKTVLLIYLSKNKAVSQETSVVKKKSKRAFLPLSPHNPESLL